MVVQEDARFRITALQQMASACTGAVITALFMTPLDVVKIRLQAQQRALLSNKCYLYCNGLMDHLCPCVYGSVPMKRLHFNGTLDAFYKIFKSEGLTSLWSGLSPTMVLAVPCTVIYFVSYEHLRLGIKEKYKEATGKNNQPLWIPLISGASARITAVTIVSPLELIRTKMQSQKLSYSEIRTALKAVKKQEGVRGLFRGLGATLLRDVPFSGIYWTTFETFKSKLKHPDSEANSFGFNFMAGAFAGSVSALITLPFDVLKTHQQIELGEKEIYADGKPQKAKTMKQIASEIYRSHGVRGLFAGLPPRLCKVAPACAIMIATFEYSKNFFYEYNMQKRSSNYVIHKSHLDEQTWS